MMKSGLLAALLAACLTIPQAAGATTLAEYIDRYNPGNGMYISREIKKAGARYDIDPLLLASVYYTESRFSNAAVSAAGAVGIAQLMPGTAAEMGADPYDAAQNIDGGAGYLRRMIDLHLDKDGDAVDYALAAYNAGPGNVEDGIPSYAYGYVRSVESEYQRLRREIQDQPTRPDVSPEIRDHSRRSRLLALLRNRLRAKQKALAENRDAKPARTARPARKSDIFF